LKDKGPSGKFFNFSLKSNQNIIIIENLFISFSDNYSAYGKKKEMYDIFY